MSKFSWILCDPIESFRDFSAVLRRLKTLGFAGVEFNLTSATLARLDELQELSETIALPIVSFLTGANYFGQGLCLSARDDAVRERAIDCLCRFTSVAARFHAVLVIGQMQGFRSDEPDIAVAEARIENALRRVAAAAEESGATVVIEPVNHLQCGFHNSLEAVLGLTRRIGSPWLKPMLDSFHINIEERSLTEPIVRAGMELSHFHLCESHGGFLGTGHLDIRSILTTLESVRYDGYVSIKVYREPWEIAAERAIQYLKSQGLTNGY